MTEGETLGTRLKAVPNDVLCQFLPLLSGRPASRIYLVQHLVKICFICKIRLKNYVLTHATLHLKSFTPQKH
jgi:hypothetical protein